MENELFSDIEQDYSDADVTEKDLNIARELKGWDDMFLKAREQELTNSALTSPYQQSLYVYRAVNIIATNFPQAKLQIIQNNRVLPPDNKLVQLFNNTPNPVTSRFEFYESIAAYLNLSGEVFIYANNSLLGAATKQFKPTELWVLNPNEVKHSLDEQNRIAGWLYGEQYIPVDQLVHVKLFNPKDTLRGLSPLTAARLEMQADYAAARYNNKFLSNGSTPEGMVEIDKDKQVDIKELRKLKRLWEENHMSPDNAGKVAFLGPGMTYKTTGLSQKDMQFLDLRKFSRESILSVYGVSNFVAGYYSDGAVTRATAKEATRLFWESTLIPQLTRVEEKFNSTFFSKFQNTYCKFDYSHIDDLKEDHSMSIDMATKLMAMGYTRNECNQALKLNMPDDDKDGDIRYMPSNLMPVDVDEGGVPETNEPKSITTKALSKTYAEDYSNIQGAMEKKLQSKIKKILFKQRKRVLQALNPKKNKEFTSEQAAQILAEINEIFSDDNFIIEQVSPVYEESLQAAGEFAQSTLGIKRPFEISETILQNRLNLITGMNNTTFERVRSRVFDGIQDGLPINDIAASIKEYFNGADARSIVVARTETNALMSEQTRETYQENGVKRKQWITIQDKDTRGPDGNGDTRADHWGMHEEERDIDEPFSNGLMQPGDTNGPAYETVNCRCALAPVVEVE